MRRRRLRDEIQELKSRQRRFEMMVDSSSKESLRNSIVVGELWEKVQTMGFVKHDMVKIDALTAMMSELARRVDLAGIPNLPEVCVCESCGCKK